MAIKWLWYSDSLPRYFTKFAESIKHNQVEPDLLDNSLAATKSIIQNGIQKIEINIGLINFGTTDPCLLLICCCTMARDNKLVCLIDIKMNISHPDFDRIDCIASLLDGCKGKIASFWNESEREDIFKGLQVDSYFATKIPLQNLLQIEKFKRLFLQDIRNIRELLLCEQKLPIDRLDIDFKPGDELPRMFYPEMMIELDGKPNESLFRQEYQRSFTLGIHDEFYIYLLPQVFVELIASGLAIRIPFLVEDLYDPRLLIQIWNFADHFDLIWRAASPL